MQKSTLAKILPIVLVILFALTAGWNLFHPGLPPTHDGEYHVIRFYEFDKELRGGNLYPRWAPDLNKGYGVPLFNYVYPLPNYVASFSHFFGISFIDAFKLNLFFALFFAAVFMYLWGKLHWGVWGGVVAASFYTFAPYHLLDIYIRGSVGEVWALAFFPAFLWSATKLLKEKHALFLPISSLFFSLIIFSHNILALLFFPFALTYMLFLVFDYARSVKDKIRPWHYFVKHSLQKSFAHFVKLVVMIILGIGLSAIFWLPAILERQYVGGLEIFDYKGHFVEVYQLIFPSWGSGFSADPTTEGLSLQIGIANLAVLAIVIALSSISRNYRKIGIVNFTAMWIMLSVFFMLPVSLPLWERLPLIQYFQFPWRFLSLVILGCSFLAGSVVYYKKYEILIVVLVLLPIVFGVSYTKPAYYHMRDDEYYVTRSNFIDGTNSPGNAFNTIWFNKSLPKATSFSSESGQTITINKAYFPGWQAFVNGNAAKTDFDKNGLIVIDKPVEKSTIEIEFLDTPIRTFAKLVSLVSLAAFCILLIISLRVRMKKYS